MLIFPVGGYIAAYSNCRFGNTNLLSKNISSTVNLNPQIQPEEKSQDNNLQNRKLLYVGVGLAILALSVCGGIKYFGRKPAKVGTKKSVQEAKPCSESVNSNSDKPPVDYLAKLKQLFPTPEKSYLVERNINKENKEIFHYLLDNAQTLELKSMSDVAFYLRSINRENKEFVFGQVLPKLKSRGFSSTGEISDIINSTVVGDLDTVNHYIKIKEDCYNCNSFTPLYGDKGFSGVYGLKSVMLELHNKFIIPLRKKISGDVSRIPNGIIIYGPDGCGKTHLVKALAGQTGCRYGELEPSLDAAEQMESLRNILEKAAKGSSSKHSLCLIDNAEWFLGDTELPKEELLEIFQTCSEKYKCTFVFTLKDKNFIPNELNTLGIEKVHVPKPDYNVFKEVLFKSGFENPDIDEIILELYNQCDKYSGSSFSTEQVISLIRNLRLDHNLSKASLIKAINEETPILTAEMLKNEAVL